MNKYILIAVIVIVTLIGGFYILNSYIYNEKQGDGKNQSLNTYSSAEYNFSFQYPNGYYLKDRNDIGTPEMPQLAVILVEDTQENRDLLDGKITEPRDGPVAITIDALQNPNKLNAEDWIKQDTNWYSAVSATIVPATVGSLKGISYTFDGLYMGKSFVVTKDTKTFVITVSWHSPTDQIVKDFDTILNSFK